SNGKFLWARSLSGPSYEGANSIAVDFMGNVYTTGVFMGIYGFNSGEKIPDHLAIGLEDIFITKHNSFGDLVWVKSIGSSTRDEGLAITVDYLGNVYTTGYYSGTADFDISENTFNLTSKG